MNDDLISREALKEAIRKRLGISSLKYLTEQERVVVEEIDNAPTVEAYPFEQVQELVKLNQQFAWEIANLKRPQGKWIDEGQYAEGHSEHYYRCSECGGHIIELRVDDFCKHCGADMRVKDELNKELNERPQIISCFNCKHDYKTETEEPCKYCNEKFSEWEVGGEK